MTMQEKRAAYVAIRDKAIALVEEMEEVLAKETDESLKDELGAATDEAVDVQWTLAGMCFEFNA